MMSIYTGYWVLLSTFTLKFVAIGAFNTSGLYLGPLAESFPYASKGTLALHCTIQIVAGLASSFAGGIAQDYLENMEFKDWMQNGMKDIPSSFNKIKEELSHNLELQDIMNRLIRIISQ